jgi:hypothetical protein
MASVKLDDLENAIVMVDSGLGDAKAWVERETGIIYMRNDEYMDDEAPLPADIDIDDDDARYVAVPGAREFHLGHALAFRFTESQLPGDEEKVREFFRKPGAYARFSRLVESRGARDEWHRFREEETKAALRAWCDEHGLELDES